MNELNLKGCGKVSDNSVFGYEINICNNVGENISEQSPISFTRYRLNDIPWSFFICEETFVKVKGVGCGLWLWHTLVFSINFLAIDRIQKSLTDESNVHAD